MNPQPPQIYSSTKLDKPGYRIGLIFSYVTTPAVNISKISTSYKKYKTHSMCCKFPSILPQDTVRLVSERLDKNHVKTITISDILNAPKICLEKNHCQLTTIPLLADFCTNEIENSVTFMGSS